MWMKANMMFLVFALFSCSQAIPVAQEQTHDMDLKGSNYGPTPGSRFVLNNPEENKGSVQNKFQKEANIKSDEDKNLFESPPLLPKVHSQTPVTSFPIVESLPPLSKETGNGKSQPSEISKEFTRKVLQAFFAELKNRPDLVDEILRRETNKLLMNIALEENDFNSIPPDVELKQEIVPALDIEEPDTTELENPKSVTETITSKEKDIAKKSTQENVKMGQLKTPSSIPRGDSSASEVSNLEAALAKELDNIGKPVKNTDTGSSSKNKGDNAPSQQLLIDPYYYYVYYDENEIPNTKSIDKIEDGGQSPTNDSNNEIEKAKNAENRQITPDNDLESIPDSGKAHDIIVEKIASAMRSVITRDMENQLAKSKLALEDMATTSNDQQAQSLQDVKFAQVDQKAIQNNRQPSDEEMELTKLSQR